MSKIDKSEIPSPSEDSAKDGNKGRRRLIKSLAATGIVSATIPDKWAQPVVDSVILPAHSQTTNGGPQFVGNVLDGIVGIDPTTRNRSDDIVDFFVSPAIAADDLGGACIELRTASGNLFDGDTLNFEIIKDGVIETGSATVSGETYSGSMDGEPDADITFKHIKVNGIVISIFVVITNGGSIYSAFCSGGDGNTFTCTTALKETSTSAGATVSS
ncbi:MAG: hypothetical protein ACI8P9_002010 [Parasphingorhabdus sp.]|jgi:hypothetical protein